MLPASARRTAGADGATRWARPPTADGRRPSGGKPFGLDGRCRREAQATERQNTEEQRDDHGGIVVVEEAGEEREGEQHPGVAGHPAPDGRAAQKSAGGQAKERQGGGKLEDQKGKGVGPARDDVKRGQQVAEPI